MLHNTRVAFAAVIFIGLSGCAAKSTWMGADAEKAYDKELETKRMAEVLNNDDYYEIHKDGRIYVLADAKGYKTWLQTNEIPLGVTLIGSGPHGETLRFELNKKEAKVMESKVGFHGGAQNMYEGKTEGLPKGFFGFVMDKNVYHVFDNWKQLESFRKNGRMPEGSETVKGGAPDGSTVVYANKSADLVQRFKDTNTP
jgi:hypothetical protein